MSNAAHDILEFVAANAKSEVEVSTSLPYNTLNTYLPGRIVEWLDWEPGQGKFNRTDHERADGTLMLMFEPLREPTPGAVKAYWDTDHRYSKGNPTYRIKSPLPPALEGRKISKTPVREYALFSSGKLLIIM